MVERLAEVVVGAAIEAEHAILDLVPRRQENDRGESIDLSEASEQRQAVLPRQPPIEQDEIPPPGLQGLPGGSPVRRMLDNETLLPKSAHQVVGDVRLVLDHQDADSHQFFLIPSSRLGSPRREWP